MKHLTMESQVTMQLEFLIMGRAMLYYQEIKLGRVGPASIQYKMEVTYPGYVSSGRFRGFMGAAQTR